MTKKDFELIAKTIRSLDLRTPSCPSTDYHMRTVARAFAKALRSTNPRDEDKAGEEHEERMAYASPEEFTRASLADLDRMMEEA
jgi:hypothetical protein